MRGLRIALFLLPAAFTALTLYSQDSGSGPADGPQGVARSPYSTKADLAVPVCPATFNDGLATDGIAARREPGVVPPKPLHATPAFMTNETRRALPDDGPYVVVLIGVVGVDGQFQNVCLRRSAGYGLDATSAQAAMNNRFSPAMKDGKPVPFRLPQAMTFRLGGRL